MTNKISSFNLKSDSNNAWSEVFVAQPDSLKESLAGKIFVLAEFAGKKNDGEKIFNFLVSSLEDTYYNDEKLLLKEKVEGLKTENIFEASLVKTNIALTEFLEMEKLMVNPKSTNLTIGVVFENRIHFSNFGKNRALLIYPQKKGYEIINVETNAFEKEDDKNNNDINQVKAPKVFSSVISGEVPKNSYFVFSSEALPEYISEKELSSIISKLPPMTAAFQIKNVLEKINNHIPFFGVIIKSASESENHEAIEDMPSTLSAHSSISSLKNTEQKTEELLSTGNIINLGKLSGKFKEMIKGPKGFSQENKKIMNRLYKKNQVEEELEEDPVEEPLAEVEAELEIKTVDLKQTTDKPKEKAKADFGIIRTLGTVKRDSDVKEKFVFKKPQFNIFSNLKTTLAMLNPLNIFKGAKPGTNKRKQQLMALLPILIIILVVSIFANQARNERLAEEAKFEEISAEINRKESMLEAKMLYDDRDGAAKLLNEIEELIAQLPADNKNSQEIYDNLAEKSQKLQDRIYLINRISNGERTYDLSSMNINKLVFANDTLFALNNKSIFNLNGSENPEKIDIADNINNYRANYFENNLYFLGPDALYSFNPKNNEVSSRTITKNEAEKNIKAFGLFSNFFYSLADNKIYKHQRGTSNYAAPSEWLAETADLSLAQDMYIDGAIYILNTDGSILRYYVGKKEEYRAAKLEPQSGEFNKLIAGDTKFYIFNPEAKRLAVIDKNSGALNAQYIFNDIVEAKDVAVDEKNNTIYILDGTTLVKFKLE